MDHNSPQIHHILTTKTPHQKRTFSKNPLKNPRQTIARELCSFFYSRCDLLVKVRLQNIPTTFRDGPRELSATSPVRTSVAGAEPILLCLLAQSQCILASDP